MVKHFVRMAMHECIVDHTTIYSMCRTCGYRMLIRHDVVVTVQRSLPCDIPDILTMAKTSKINYVIENESAKWKYFVNVTCTVLTLSIAVSSARINSPHPYYLPIIYEYFMLAAF